MDFNSSGIGQGQSADYTAQKYTGDEKEIPCFFSPFVMEKWNFGRHTGSTDVSEGRAYAERFVSNQ
jgi:hypothetical protein